MSSNITYDPLREPIRMTEPSQDAPWRDNAWLAFWDRAAGLIGVAHASTSPNSGARHTRWSLLLDGRLKEIIEPVEPGTFTGDTVSFNLDEGITVDAPGMKASVQMEPLFAFADFTGGAVFPSVLDRRPLNHYQQAATVTGHIEIDGRSIEIDGQGFRDRTWGYRDESASISEYIATQCVFEDFSLCAMRFHVTHDGSDRAEGFVLGEDAERIGALTGVVRGRRGEVLEMRLELDSGRAVTIEVGERLGGFPVPVAPERNTGPTISSFEEFCAVRTTDGASGFGIIGQGSTRNLC
jgi:hypothetical protein